MKTIRIILTITLILAAAFPAFAESPAASPQTAEAQLKWLTLLDKPGWDSILYLSAPKKVVFFYHGKDQSEPATNEIITVVRVAKQYDTDVLRFLRVDLDSPPGAAIWGYLSQGAAFPSKTPRFYLINPGFTEGQQPDPKKARASLVQMDDLFLTEADLREAISQGLNIPSPVAVVQPPAVPLAGTK